MRQELLIVEDLETLTMVKDYISSDDFNYVAYDTETTGVDDECEIVGFSLCAEEHMGIYVVLSYWEPSVSEEKCIDCPPVEFTKAGKPKKPRKCKVCDGSRIVTKSTGHMVYNNHLKEVSREIIAILLTKSLIMHHCAFDCKVTRRTFGIELIGSVHTDTMELAHVLDENSYCGLKEVGYRLFGEDAKKEQTDMHDSVVKNGGIWSEAKGEKGIKEMYKADRYLLGKYGAKDAILTFRIFQTLIPQLFEEGLDKFFYEEESMPLLRGPTYQLNTDGLKLDVAKLKSLEVELENECKRLEAEILEEIFPKVKDRFPGTNKNNSFNIGSSSQVAWLLFIRLGNDFKKLTDGGRDLAKALVQKMPYNASARRAFITAIGDERRTLQEQLERTEHVESQKALRKRINKLVPEKYLKCDKDALTDYAKKYPWVQKLLYHNAYDKLLQTYCKGIARRSRYGIIHPSFKQHGTTSGRYSSSNPNFQNLPREDKRIKACIVARPNKVFVGADYSQLEPRCFASVSQDPALMSCFEKGEDFYSVVGIPIFKDFAYSAFKKHPKSWAEAYPNKRHISKAFALAKPYGTTAFQQADKLRDEEGNRMTPQACQAIMDAYEEAYPSVHQMMLDSHEMAKKNGVVYNLFGRPRRIPEAQRVARMYGMDTPHDELPYDARTWLNLAMNHRVQSTAASIVNRAMIAFYNKMLALGIDAKIVLQVHDEIIVECWEKDQEVVERELKIAMEQNVTLPGVELVAEPKIAKNLAELK